MLATTDQISHRIDPLELRRAFGTFVTGITVITTIDGDGNPRGLTANSFTSVSLDPPLLLVCIGKSAGSFSAFNDCRSFAVNFLHEGQKPVAAVFASKSPDKFRDVDHHLGVTGAPVLRDCLSWFDCTPHSRVEAGDHLILVGQVQAFGTGPSSPLGFCRGRYASIKDPLSGSYGSSHGMVIGYLIEADDGVLLRADGQQGWTLPTARRRKADNELKLDNCDALRLLPDKTFLYSVFDVADSEPGYLIYRARLSHASGDVALPEDLKFFPLDAIPYDAIATRQVRTLLLRYARERDTATFGIYMDSDDGGRLAVIDGDARPWDQVASEQASGT